MASTLHRINSEIARMEALKNSLPETMEAKLMVIKLSELMGPLTDEEQQKKKAIENFYRCSDIHITHKIKFWTQFKAGEMESHMLTTMNETMTEWIEAAWEYFGQANIKEESDNVKKEYEMFKMMFGICKIKEQEKTKKKTRRGGKKHKKPR